MSSTNYEASIFGHDLDALVISHNLHISYPPKSNCRDESIEITHIYLSFQRRCQYVNINSFNITQKSNIWHDILRLSGTSYLHTLDLYRIETCEILPSKFGIGLPRLFVSCGTWNMATVSHYIEAFEPPTYSNRARSNPKLWLRNLYCANPKWDWEGTFLCQELTYLVWFEE